MAYSWVQVGAASVILTNHNTPTSSFLAIDNETFGLSLTVADPSGLTDSVTVDGGVDNVAPVVGVGADVAVLSGDAVAFTGSFFDPGTGDAHTII